MLVLLVEDHRLVAETISEFLALEGFEVDYASNGLQGLTLATTNTYDALILDVNMPGLDGFSLCHQLRQDHGIETPILFLTARDQIDDKLSGFEQGADDYLVKPFDHKELLVRIMALIKRQRGEVIQKRLSVGPLIIDTGTQQVWREDEELEVSPTGFRLLKVLMRESPNVVSRETLEQELWGSSVPDTDVLRSHIYNLRKSVDQPYETTLIHTVKGVGLKMQCNPEGSD